jgi:hypothetical protein
MATQAIPVGGFPSRVSEPVRVKFERLAGQWEEDTEFVSSSTQMILNGAYQQIIGMGEPVLPLIFERLKTQGGHWFWALMHITGENPISPDKIGNYEEMREVWLSWGREHHYF